MSDDVEHNHDQDEIDPTELLQELGADTKTQIFLSMRQQNIELLDIAARIAGFSDTNAPLSGDDTELAMRTIWKLYSEFYSWVDPEEVEDEDDDE